MSEKPCTPREKDTWKVLKKPNLELILKHLGVFGGVLKSCGSTGPLCLSAEKNSGRGKEMDKK